MIRKLCSLFIPLLIIVTAGCKDTSNTSASLVIDLTAVARELGRDEVMNAQFEQARQQLNSQLVQISADLEKQLQEKKDELDKAPKNKKEESQKEIELLTQQANLQLRKTQQLANQKAIQYRDQLLADFKKDVMVVAEQIAEKRNAVTILTAGSDLFWYASTIDITDEVIGKMRAAGNAGENTVEPEVTDKPAAAVQDAAES